MLPNPEIRQVTLLDYVKVIQKRIGILIAFVIVIPSVTIIVDFTKKPVYRATVSILIEKALPKVTRFEEVAPGAYWGATQEYYQTQYKILSSYILAEQVLAQLRLTNDPEYQGIKDPVRKLNSQIRVEPIRNSQVVLVHVEDTDPLRGSSIANTVAKAYVQQDIENRNRAAKEATVWLETQLSGVKQKGKEAEEALNDYIQQNKIVALPDIERKVQGLLESLKANKAALETDIAEVSERYKEKHPKMMALKAQLDEVTKKIETETNSVLDLNQKLVQYNLLKKEVDATQGLYTSMLSRTKEADLTEKLQTSSIRVIDPARPPEVPFKPQKQKDAFRSIMFSLLFGSGLIFLIEYLDASIRTADDVSVYLALPFLGYVPRVAKEVATDKERCLVCTRDSKSIIAESFRSVRTSVLFTSPEDKPLRCILVTSPLPQEGKTFVACNLATIFSQLNERIVLVDIDMRRPKVHKVFGTQQKIGLSNFLTGSASLDTIIYPSAVVNNLSLITAGVIPPNPSELLSSGKIRVFFEEIKSRFDRVIVDSPPVLSASDALLLANLVDGVVIVVRGGKTHVETIRQTKAKIQEAKGRILGVIVNNIEPEKEDRYYYYHYYYGSTGQEKKSKS